MSNRKKLVEQTARIIWREDSATTDRPWDAATEPLRIWYRSIAEVVVDALLPQITTVEELEALPETAIVTGKDGSAWEYSSFSSPHQWFGTNGDDWSTSDIWTNFGPLTVVWRPDGDS